MTDGKQKQPNGNRVKQRAQFTKEDRAYVYARDKGVCGICHEPTGPFGWTIDHVKPVSHGGSHIPSNWVLAHRSCNTAQSNRRARTAIGGYVR